MLLRFYCVYQVILLLVGQIPTALFEWPFFFIKIIQIIASYYLTVRWLCSCIFFKLWLLISPRSFNRVIVIPVCSAALHRGNLTAQTHTYGFKNVCMGDC